MSDTSRRSSTAGAAFPITAWTQVMQVQRGDQEARQALEVFCQNYWPASHLGGGAFSQTVSNSNPRFFYHAFP